MLTLNLLEHHKSDEAQKQTDDRYDTSNIGESREGRMMVIGNLKHSEKIQSLFPFIKHLFIKMDLFKNKTCDFTLFILIDVFSQSEKTSIQMKRTEFYF